MALLAKHFSAVAVAKLCGGRSKRWAIDRAKAGDFGRCFFDSRGWLIPESGVLAYLKRHTVGSWPQDEECAPEELPQPVFIRRAVAGSARLDCEAAT